MSSPGDRVVWDGYLSIVIPNGWEWRDDDGVVSIYDPNGVGAVQISFAVADDPAVGIDPEAFVRCFVEGRTFKNIRTARTVLGGLAVSYFEGNTEALESSFWRVWSAGRNGRVATISYTCGKADSSTEKASVDSLIKSVEWLF